MSIDVICQITEIISSFVSIFAVIIGGLWVYRNYIMNRLGVWNLEMKLVPEQIYLNTDYSLLVVNYYFTNKGKIKITPGSNGCKVIIKCVSFDKDGQATEKSDAQPLFDKDILKKYCRKDRGYDNYEIEPNTKYHEISYLPVKKDSIVLIRVEFFWKKNHDSVIEEVLYHIDGTSCCNGKTETDVPSV